MPQDSTYMCRCHICPAKIYLASPQKASYMRGSDAKKNCILNFEHNDYFVVFVI